MLKNSFYIKKTWQKKLQKIALAITLALGTLGCNKTDENGIKDIYDVRPATTRPVEKWKSSVEFIVDTSNSMSDKLNGERKIDSAKKAMLGVLELYKQHNDQSQNIEAGMLCFEGDGVKKVVPLSRFDYELLRKEVNNLRISGGTPLGIAIAYAERELDRNATGMKNIVLLTDGENSVGEEPEKVYRKIGEVNLEIGDSFTKAYVIAFNIDWRYFKPLQDLGARVTEAKDASSLADVLKTDATIILEREDPEERGYEELIKK